MVIAFSFSSRRTLFWILRLFGVSINGNVAISFSFSAVICKIIEVRLVRRIFGSVNFGRERKSFSE